MNKIPLTVIIITKNEENNIERCLKACIPTSEIFIVDSQSTDKTVEIAKKYVPKKNIINFEWNKKWPKKKYWSLLNLPISNEWVLMLDADEIPTKAFWKKVDNEIKKDRFDAFMVFLAYSFMGKKLCFGDHIRKLSLYKYKKVIYEDEGIGLSFNKFDFEGHASPIVKGKIGLLKSKIIHNDFKGLSDYFDRHNKYSDLEANLIIKKHFKNKKKGDAIQGNMFGNISEKRRFMKNFLMNASFKPLFYFIYAYFLRLGFLDGRTGLYYIMCKCFYLIQIELKIKELKSKQYNK